MSNFKNGDVVVCTENGEIYKVVGELNGETLVQDEVNTFVVKGGDDVLIPFEKSNPDDLAMRCLDDMRLENNFLISDSEAHAFITDYLLTAYRIGRSLERAKWSKEAEDVLNEIDEIIAMVEEGCPPCCK